MSSSPSPGLDVSAGAGVGVRTSHDRLQRVVDRLPDWMGSVRFRLTAIYSLFLFGLAAMVIGGVYLALAMRLDDQPMSQQVQVIGTVPSPLGPVVVDQGTAQVISPESFEQSVNDRSLQLLRSYSFAALALLFLASLIVGWVVAGRVLAPIERMTMVARDIQATDLSRRIALRGPPDELKNLADTFDGMLERIDDAFEAQRQFIHEASHELRNPLAVIRTNLDVTLADPNATTDELRRSGEVVQRTAERMSHLVDDLLAHARHGATVRQLELVDLGPLVSEATAEFEVPAAARGLRLEATAIPGLFVLGDRLALRQALANLLANAVRLAPAGTTISVVAGSRDANQNRPTDGWNWLAVADEGPGIATEEQDLVFQRFWRGDGQRAREEGRSGLGLTIVRQVAESHRGEVKLRSNEAGGSTFTLWIPSAEGPIRPGFELHS